MRAQYVKSSWRPISFASFLDFRDSGGVFFIFK
jgi:hypothetical protein